MGYDRTLRLDGRVFVVLGAGAGIGAESARALAEVGAEAEVCDAAVAYLSSDLARHGTGHSLAVDDGLSAMAPNLRNPEPQPEPHQGDTT